MASAITDIPEPKRWKVDEFVRVYENGGLGGDDDHFELLNGDIYQKMGQSDRHIMSMRLSAKALRMAFGDAFDVSHQIPLALGELSRPEPDITVLRGDATEFATRRETPEDVALLVEIVDSRMDTARRQKVPLYAKHGIAEYWIVDVRRRVAEVRRGPLKDSEEWTETRLYSESESIKPLEAAQEIRVSDLLPPDGS